MIVCVPFAPRVSQTTVARPVAPAAIWPIVCTAPICTPSTVTRSFTLGAAALPVLCTTAAITCWLPAPFSPLIARSLEPTASSGCGVEQFSFPLTA